MHYGKISTTFMGVEKALNMWHGFKEHQVYEYIDTHVNWNTSWTNWWSIYCLGQEVVSLGFVRVFGSIIYRLCVGSLAVRRPPFDQNIAMVLSGEPLVLELHFSSVRVVAVKSVTNILSCLVLLPRILDL